MRAWILIALAACASRKPDLVVTASMTITDVSGPGPSMLDVLNGQVIAFEVVFDHAGLGHDIDNGCHRTILAVTNPTKTASGATASTVQTKILDILPEWEARLVLCSTTAASSVSLFSDNQMGLGVSFGCLDVPPAALGRDAAGDPIWSSFTGSRCDATIYDQPTGRIIGDHGFTMKFASGND